jgi:hypothetical protein
MTENYGNIAGLLEQYHGLKTENERLMNEESFFTDDCIAKRRILSITTSQLANFVLLLQNELRMQHSVGHSVTCKPEVDEGVIDFDEICQPESNLLDFLMPEFPTTASSEWECCHRILRTKTCTFTPIGCRT